MKRTVTDCDGCGQQDITPVALSLCEGRSSDGIEFTNDYANFDLCQDCAALAFGRLIGRVKLSHEDASWLSGQIKLFKRK